MHHPSCGIIPPPSSFRQHHSVHSPPGSPHSIRISPHHSHYTFALSIYHSLDLLFQTTHLFYKSFPPYSLHSTAYSLSRSIWIAFADLEPVLNYVGTVCFSFFFIFYIHIHILYLFLFFSYLFFVSGYVCYRLSWPHSAFQSMLTSPYRIVSSGF